jgi:hypothetical protein
VKSEREKQQGREHGSAIKDVSRHGFGKGCAHENLCSAIVRSALTAFAQVKIAVIFSK